jgi:hypothetical protein
VGGLCDASHRCEVGLLFDNNDTSKRLERVFDDRTSASAALFDVSAGEVGLYLSTWEVVMYTPAV